MLSDRWLKKNPEGGLSLFRVAIETVVKNLIQRRYPVGSSCFLLNILNVRPVSSFDLLIVAAISHPHHCDFKYQGPEIIPYSLQIQQPDKTKYIISRRKRIWAGLIKCSHASISHQALSGVEPASTRMIDEAAVASLMTAFLSLDNFVIRGVRFEGHGEHAHLLNSLPLRSAPILFETEGYGHCGEQILDLLIQRQPGILQLIRKNRLNQCNKTNHMDVRKTGNITKLATQLATVLLLG